MSRWVIRRGDGLYLSTCGATSRGWCVPRSMAVMFANHTAAKNATIDLGLVGIARIVRLVPKRREDKWLRRLIGAVEEWERSSVRENGEKWHIVASAAVDYVKSLKEKNP